MLELHVRNIHYLTEQRKILYRWLLGIAINPRRGIISLVYYLNILVWYLNLVRTFSFH